MWEKNDIREILISENEIQERAAGRTDYKRLFF